ncbi:hypothetical protein HPB52_023787 [Rhipicephalus sanguineus]|uniref:CCHC-type domain-containing protein n=1 Tax=Rhipicephalus sanguineus TaxID=34632 RepID=A0A9D4T106_RHISA|nr:hypothetical protein HPB52_023787 [Rhipicephalus sanguineus]
MVQTVLLAVTCRGWRDPSVWGGREAVAGFSSSDMERGKPSVITATLNAPSLHGEETSMVRIISGTLATKTSGAPRVLLGAPCCDSSFPASSSHFIINKRPAQAATGGACTVSDREFDWGSLTRSTSARASSRTPAVSPPAKGQQKDLRGSGGSHHTAGPTMAASRAEHEVSPSGAGPPSPGGSPAVSDLSFSPEGDNILAGLTGQAENGPAETAEAAVRVEPTTGSAHTRSSSRSTTPAVTSADEDDAGRTDHGAQAQARARELEDQLSRFCADSANCITVSVRNFILTRVFELVGLCSDLRADAAVERGAALALQGQLVEARREIAGQQRQALEGSPLRHVDLPAVTGPDNDVPLGARPALQGPAGGLIYAAVLRPGPLAGVQAPGRPGFPATSAGPGMVAAPAGARHEHVAFPTPTGTSDTPARDVVRTLKANIDPVAKDIRDVTLRYTRYGVTVFTNTRQSLLNMRTAIEQNAVTRAAMTIRVPEKRNPYVRFSGVDPEIGPDEFLRLLNDRNPNLQLDLERSKVCVTFRERGGTRAFVVEVDPAAFHRIMACPRLYIGWTIVRAYEDLHISTCTYCASYGHGRSSYPVASDPSKSVCMRCGAEGHLGAACTVRAGDPSVCCAPCRCAGWEASGHPAGHPECPLLLDKVARLRARTNYGGAAGDTGGSHASFVCTAEPRPFEVVVRKPLL